MFAIVVPGKVGSLSVRYACAADALVKYREMEADGLLNIDVKDAKGDSVTGADLERMADQAKPQI